MTQAATGADALGAGLSRPLQAMNGFRLATGAVGSVMRGDFAGALVQARGAVTALKSAIVGVNPILAAVAIVVAAVVMAVKAYENATEAAGKKIENLAAKSRDAWKTIREAQGRDAEGSSRRKAAASDEDDALGKTKDAERDVRVAASLLAMSAKNGDEKGMAKYAEELRSAQAMVKIWEAAHKEKREKRIAEEEKEKSESLAIQTRIAKNKAELEEKTARSSGRTLEYLEKEKEKADAEIEDMRPLPGEMAEDNLVAAQLRSQELESQIQAERKRLFDEKERLADDASKKAAAQEQKIADAKDAVERKQATADGTLPQYLAKKKTEADAEAAKYAGATDPEGIEKRLAAQAQALDLSAEMKKSGGQGRKWNDDVSGNWVDWERQGIRGGGESGDVKGFDLKKTSIFAQGIGAKKRFEAAMLPSRFGSGSAGSAGSAGAGGKTYKNKTEELAAKSETLLQKIEKNTRIKLAP
jgi:hypothetical protein